MRSDSVEVKLHYGSLDRLCAEAAVQLKTNVDYREVVQNGHVVTSAADLKPRDLLEFATVQYPDREEGDTTVSEKAKNENLPTAETVVSKELVPEAQVENPSEKTVQSEEVALSDPKLDALSNVSIEDAKTMVAAIEALSIAVPEQAKSSKPATPQGDDTVPKGKKKGENSSNPSEPEKSEAKATENSKDASAQTSKPSEVRGG